MAGTVALFLIILAFLAGQLRAGGDPALGASGSAATEQTAPRATPEPQPDLGAGPDGFDPGGSDPQGTAPAPSGSVPDQTSPDVSPPTTQQS